MEDATHALLQDFVDSLANLPAEVSHLLTEVAYLDFAKPPPSSIPDPTPPCPQLGNGETGEAKRWYSVEEARRKAATKHASIVRHAHRPPHTLLTPNPKEAQLVDRAGAHYEDGIRLSEEKQRLMTKAHALVERHLTRLNSELDKLVATTGVEVPDFKRDAVDLPASATLPVAAAPPTNRHGGVGFDFAQLGAAAGIGLTGAAGAIGTPGPGFRRRPMFQSPSLASLPPSHHPHAASHLSSTPSSLLPTSASYPTLPSQFSNPHAARQRSRLSEAHTLPSPPSHHSLPGLLSSSSGHHQPHPHPLTSSSSMITSGPPIHHRRAPARARRRRKLVMDDDDDDDYPGANDDEEDDGRVGGDEDVDMDDAEGSYVDDGAAGGSLGEEKDEELYCFCQRQSFGEMIGCDNPTCQYEWFHLSCVGLKATPANQTWFCPTCRDEKKRSGQPARARRR